MPATVIQHRHRPIRHLSDFFFQQLRQLPLLQFLVAHGLLRTVAAGLELEGIDVGPLRAPLLPLSESHRMQLQRLLKQVQEPNQ